MHIRPFRLTDEAAIVDLWQRCDLVRPWNDPYKDIQRKLQVQPELFMVGEIDGRLVASAMAGYEGHRGWVNYLAVAPEMFFRHGDPAAIGSVQEIIERVVSKVADAQVMADLDACVDWAREQGGDVKRLHATGFCWGGRITWLYSAHNPAVKAGVAWYGRLVGDATALNPKHPVDVAAQLKGPVLGLYGAADTGIPLDTVDKMKSALAGGSAAAKASTFVVYPDAPHAFHADYRPSFRKEPAEDGWKRALAWFKQHGVA